MSVEANVARIAGISYLRIPAKDAQRAAAFYEAVFAWTVDTDRAEPAFADGTGHVIGHFVVDESVAGEAGIRPYIFVESVDETLAAVASNAGAVVAAPYRKGELRVATFRDPEGNVVGLWQVTSPS
jgi:predicted enzyme related to lactoylglutathione lyase